MPRDAVCLRDFVEILVHEESLRSLNAQLGDDLHGQHAQSTHSNVASMCGTLTLAFTVQLLFCIASISNCFPNLLMRFSRTTISSFTFMHRGAA